MSVLDVKLGFGFSAGLLDYVLNYGLATRPLLLIPVGLAYAAIYYTAFTVCIRRFDIKTPGRDADTAKPDQPQDRTSALIQALGGKPNFMEVDACTTRLRLLVADASLVDEGALRASGARGVLKLGNGRVQVIVGTEADQLARTIRESLREGEAHPAAVGAELASLVASLDPERIELRGRRLIVITSDPTRISADVLLGAGAQAVMVGANCLHLIGNWHKADWSRWLQDS
jgi:PTS system N-acetylglucosamine-specific IIC component